MAVATQVPTADIIVFPQSAPQVASSCGECGSTIIDRTLRVFCDPCIEMNDGTPSCR